MPSLKAVPHSNFYIDGKIYTADADGLIAEADPHHVAALVRAGCVVSGHWSHPAPQAPPPEPEPAKPEAPKVKLRAPRPHMNFAPESGSTVRYTADADRLFDAAPEHVKALMRAGCARL